jgi:hypothetical protein
MEQRALAVDGRPARANRTFLASHARALLPIAHDPEVRLRDIAASRGITERSAYGTVTDPAGPASRSNSDPSWSAEAQQAVRDRSGRRPLSLGR